MAWWGLGGVFIAHFDVCCILSGMAVQHGQSADQTERRDPKYLHQLTPIMVTQ